jgi:hypothetical protein
VSALLAELLEAPDVPPAKGRGPPTILVPLDQAEELFIADGREESKAALALLTELMKRGELAVLATIRTDSYGGMQTTLADIKQSAFSLTPMARGAYQRVIEGPAERLARTATASSENRSGADRGADEATSRKAAPRTHCRCSPSRWSGSISNMARMAT